MDLAGREGIAKLFKAEHFQRVIHLAAQAGVRYSIEAPFEYVDSNLIVMMTILEGCRHNKVEHLVYASSSSVYVMTPKIPFATSDNVDHPVSLYAAAKKSNELMVHSYSHLYNIPTTGLRFFTVYGPAGRPNMAPWLLTEAIPNDQPIKVFNNGRMQRDFTYIDDIYVFNCLKTVSAVDELSVHDPLNDRFSAVFDNSADGVVLYKSDTDLNGHFCSEVFRKVVLDNGLTGVCFSEDLGNLFPEKLGMKVSH